MATQYSSSPGPSDVRPPATGSGTAFQSLSDTLRLNQTELYQDPYYQLVSAADASAQMLYMNNLYVQLVATPASAGTKYPNAFEELQTLLRAKGLSKGKSAIGQLDPLDIPGIINATKISFAQGQTDVIAFLKGFSGVGSGTGVKQVDTTNKFTTQVTRALQLKDKGDAMRTLTDAYMLAFGQAPSNDLITDFEKKWNAELRAQTPATTTRTAVKYVPVYDSKTGKQKIGKDGKPKFKALYNAEGVKQYETVTTSGTETPGEGFTNEEQKAFMANYLATNFPSKNWNLQEVGGAAKQIYDAIVQTANNNFETPPSFEEASTAILQILGTGNENSATELMQQYVNSLRNKASKRFMSLAPDIASGQDAKAVANPYIDKVSAALETSVGLEDPLMLSILNYKDEKGNYRLPNDFELSKMIMADPRRGKTSAAINEAVNLAQSLRSQLQIG